MIVCLHDAAGVWYHTFEVNDVIHHGDSIHVQHESSSYHLALNPPDTVDILAKLHSAKSVCLYQVAGTDPPTYTDKAP